MSGFVVVYQASSQPIDPRVFERVMSKLAHRGPDGHDACVLDHAILGHWHFWTTPEEVGERQPIELKEAGLSLVLDGRLDNRSELLSQLKLKSSESGERSDASLLLQAYTQWGEACLERCIGEYAFVIFDQRRARLLCGRDALGGRTMFYSWQGSCLVLASEPWAVACANGLPAEINESALPYYFAMKAPEDGRTLFRNVYEVLPGHGLAVTASGTRSWRYWQPELKMHPGRSDQEYAEQFRSLLEVSVECRMRSITPVGVLMSGGLDSGSVACLAARRLAPQPLTTISYVFDELKDCDERPYIEAITNQWGIRSLQFTGDQSWPFKNWEKWPSNPNHPCGNPFRLLMEQVYRQAQREGLRVLLTGGGGDQLYSRGIHWLEDLLSEGRFLAAGRGLSRYLRQHGLRRTWNMGFLQRAARYVLSVVLGERALPLRRDAPAWLTALSSVSLQEDQIRPAPIIEKHVSLLSMGVARNYSWEAFSSSRHECELRHPYRDSRLVEFMLSLPAYQLHYEWNKQILRTAMQGLLPDAIRTRPRSNTYNSLFVRGIEREKAMLEARLKDPDTTWPRYIRRDWMAEHWKRMLSSGAFRREDIILWACLSYEAWQKTFISSAPFCEVQNVIYP